MTDDLLPILRKRYPAILGDPLLREIGCLPGWSPLLDDLCKALQGHRDAHPELPAVRVVRIKEKWGELRFIYGGGDKVCREQVDKAVESSLMICEVCGETGELIGERWFSVLCPAHITWSPDPAGAAAATAAERNAALLSDKGITNLGIAISPRALRLDGPSP
ncbi:hypothetical protein QN375_18460 [Pseudomonas sp. MH9.2]|uniref:hypothetical protein n=1 Tax=Pseudomonas sp. MH9.2 TaxID=3048629 RepID=UPI002AC92F88|nr:hypothetical protein [Pseudomonas sp. MH9.2]MEB0027735.1 hypothetical protein [Pseudomonas sp. MH9.2]WPX68529.1 hypothetical protein RHM55_22790 [Pseudomonas sp. MH9.2]